MAQSMAHTLRQMMQAAVVGCFGSGADGLQAPEVLNNANIALIDIRLSDGYAFDLVAELQVKYPRLRLIWFTALSGDYPLHRASEAKLPGFVHKDEPLDMLVSAITVVDSGVTFISPMIMALQARLRENSNNCFRILSRRELEVIRYLGCGYSNEEVARVLGLSAGTIHTHRRNIMLKLKLHSAADLMSYAIRHDFVDPKCLRVSELPVATL